MNIREMIVDDIPTVAELERRCFPNPWNEQMIYKELTENRRAQFFVVDRQGSVVGHTGLWKNTSSIHVTTIAVQPEFRRRGVATALVTHVIDHSRRSDRTITLEVRPSNEAAIALYRDLGFEIVGRRKNYYSNNNEDALIMDHASSQTTANSGYEHSRQT